MQSAITLSQTIRILITIGTPNYRLSNKVRVEEDNDQVPNKTYNIFCLDLEGMDKAIVDFETCLATSISRNVYKGPMALGTTVACVTNARTWHNALLIERASFTKIMSSSKTTMEKEKKLELVAMEHAYLSSLYTHYDVTHNSKEKVHIMSLTSSG